MLPTGNHGMFSIMSPWSQEVRNNQLQSGLVQSMKTGYSRALKTINSGRVRMWWISSPVSQVLCTATTRLGLQPPESPHERGYAPQLQECWGSRSNICNRKAQVTPGSAMMLILPRMISWQNWARDKYLLLNPWLQVYCFPNLIT